MVDAGPQDRQSLDSLQVLRGLAASVVAFYHTHLILAQPEYGGHALFGSVASRGWLGVNLFFILSGFIIVYAHSRDINRPDAIASYVMKRFIRLYPIYWIFLGVYILAALAGVGHPDFEWSTANLVSAFLLIKLAEPLTLPLRVAWTLFYELTFYAVFVLFLINRTMAIAAFAAWSAIILIAVVVFDHRDMGLLNIWNLYFPIGMLGYLAYRRFPPQAGPAIFFAGLVSFSLCAVSSLGDRARLAESDPIALMAFALPCCLLIVGATLSEKHYQWKPHRLFLLLGEASYSIYLLHSSIISVIAILYAKFQPAFIAPWMLFFLTAAISVFGGVVAHKIIEVPVLKFLRQAFLKPRGDGRRTAGSTTVTISPPLSGRDEPKPSRGEKSRWRSF